MEVHRRTANVMSKLKQHRREIEQGKATKSVVLVEDVTNEPIVIISETGDKVTINILDVAPIRIDEPKS